MQTLIQYGADIEIDIDPKGTPLAIAVKSFKSRDAAIFLLQHGARIICQGAETIKNTVLHIAIEAPDWTIVEKQQFSMVRLLMERFPELLATNEAVNAVNAKGDTPLHYAAALGDYDSAQILLENGANPNTVNNKGFTPYMNAQLSRYFILQKVRMIPDPRSPQLSTLH